MTSSLEAEFVNLGILQQSSIHECAREGEMP